MHGRKVYEFALSKVPLALKSCLESSGRSLSELKKIFLHQANLKMDEAIINRFYGLYNKKMPENILWVERYRPQTVKDCILPEYLQEPFQSYVDNKTIPNILLNGGPGMGKTTIARAMCKEIGLDYLMINGSQDTGIDLLRNKLDKEDYGQTLGTWGINEGCYFVLPILGPTTVRDTVGMVIDNNYLDPFARVTWHEKEIRSISGTKVDYIGVQAATAVDFRGENMTNFESLEKNLQRANKGNVRGFFDIKFLSNSDCLMTFEIEIPKTCLNPLGTVQGGMIVSILDETTAYHVNIITNDKLIPNSTDIHVSFHRPLLIGQCFSRTEILKLGKKVVSIKGQVFSTDNKLIATALHTGLLLSTEKLK